MLGFALGVAHPCVAAPARAARSAACDLLRRADLHLLSGVDRALRPGITPIIVDRRAARDRRDDHRDAERPRPRAARAEQGRARASHLARSRTALLIELPAAAPYLFTGVKLAVGYGFIGVIAGEFILSGAGLGYAIAYAYNDFDNQTMYALMLLVLVVGDRW